ncbi:MAG: Rod shape-determining protein MreC, partial [Chitinophagaceae bacterium]|nr:Rod shape-determining protein MreC [Chitinophagaceae bacterium]
MRNVFLFIRRFSNFFLFLALQVIALIILSRYNQTHQAMFSGTALEVTGRFEKQYNNFQYFFNLKETNRKLVEENTRLHNLLLSNFKSVDTARKTVIDSIYRDTSGRVRRFTWLPAKVVGNSIFEENNFIVLERGRNQGVTEDMAVVGPDGIVGKVVTANANYTLVMSLLNRNSKVSGMLKRSAYNGIVDWDGSSPSELTLRNIPKSAEVKKGDTVITSNLSGNFPEG